MPKTKKTAASKPTAARIPQRKPAEATKPKTKFNHKVNQIVIHTFDGDENPSRFTIAELIAHDGRSPNILEVFKTAKGGFILYRENSKPEYRYDLFDTLESLKNYLAPYLDCKNERRLFLSLGGSIESAIKEV
jgi:hypothetical protein